jgi:4-hydroxybenzoate polyprenyltransferase
VRISPWLLAFSMFFFLSLALLKRYVELRSAKERGTQKLDRRNYEIEDEGLVESMGLTSGYLSVLVLGLFVSSDDVRLLYQTPEVLWGTSLIMLYWVTRMWFLARRGYVPDDPVLFAARDRVSYACGLCLAVVVAVASW